jgi:hypothetical protein
MSRLMSVALTEPQVVGRTKTVTRRLGWLNLKPGDRLTLCRKVMGRRAGEPLVRLAEVEVVSVRRERLDTITEEDIVREAVPHDHFWPAVTAPSPNQWVTWFCDQMGVMPDTEVTRIEWRYLDPPGGAVPATDAAAPPGTHQRGPR